MGETEHKTTADVSEIADNETTACPECDSSGVRQRLQKEPPYVCNDCGSEFDEAIVRTKQHHNRGRPSGSLRTICGNCDATNYTNATTRVTCTCGNGYEPIHGWLRGIADEGDTLHNLVSGPVPFSEIEIHKRHALSMVSTVGTRLHNGQRRYKSVIFLPGDERRAASLFIDLNESFCRGMFDMDADGSQVDRAEFDDSMVDLIREQWILEGYESD